MVVLLEDDEVRFGFIPVLLGRVDVDWGFRIHSKFSEDVDQPEIDIGESDDVRSGFPHFADQFSVNPFDALFLE